MAKSALILGSTGLIGRSLIDVLNGERGEAFSKVNAAVRKVDMSLPNNGRINQVKVDYEQMNQFQTFLNVDVIFCCLGTTIKVAGSKERFRRVDFEYVTQIAQMFSEANPQGHFIVVSSLGADPKSNVFYFKVKGQVEAFLKEPPLNRVTVLRPSLLLGKRQDIRIGERVGEFVSLLLKPFLIGPLKKYRAIQASVVAKAMVELANLPAQIRFNVIESDHIEQIGH